jgi:hypothetical protein
VCKKNSPANSYGSFAKTFFIKAAIYSLVYLVPPGFKGKNERFRATLTLVETTLFLPF